MTDGWRAVAVVVYLVLFLWVCEVLFPGGGYDAALERGFGR